MRAKLVLAVVLALGVFGAQSMHFESTAEARPRPKRNSSTFEANKGFGLGFQIGVPTGLAGKYYLSRDTALDFALAVYRYGRDRYDDAYHLHVTHLWHPFVLAQSQALWLPMYVGVGARVLDHGDRDFADDLHFGVRAPIGLALDFNNIPLDIFFELALVIDVITTDDHGYSDVNGSLGIRYYFN